MKNFIRTLALFTLAVVAVALLVTANMTIFNETQWITLNFQIYSQLLVYVILFVVTGAIISILISKSIVKIFLSVRAVKTPESINELRLFSTVKRLSDAVGISMPEIMIYQGYDINAFATGFSRNNALLAVSQQLLDVMTQDEMEGVIGHEISHIANGDMLTLALMQGVVNSLVYLPANAVKFILNKLLGTQKNYHVLFYYLIVTLTQLSFAWIASLLVMWFSRQREFHADLCGAKIAGHESMLRALECLQACNGKA